MELLESMFSSSLILRLKYRCFITSTYGYRYKWTTYGEIAIARSAIGSGLVAHGITKVCNRYSNFSI